MRRAYARRIAAILLGAGFAAAAASPGATQTLNIPVESQIRPIQTSVLFQQLFYNFFPESDGTTYVQTGVIQRDAKNILVDPHAEAFSADYTCGKTNQLPE